MSARARPLVALGFLLAMMPARLAAAEQSLLLSVQVNTFAVGKVGEFVVRDGVVLARPAELIDLGFRIGTSVPVAPDGLVRLADVPGVTSRLDASSQTIFITAPDSALTPALLTPETAAVASRTIDSGTGASLNYDLNDSVSGGRNAASGLFDLRLFSPFGVISSDALVFIGAGPRGGGFTPIRLDTSYTFSDPAQLRRYRVGDFISGSLGWTRAVHLGGIQVTSDFALRPDLVTFPLPTVSGSAAVPSTVDVLVNGNRLLSREVGAGPFQIPSLPVVSGAGTVSLAVTDALGRQTVVTLPFYANVSLLARGLQTFSAQAGAIRRNIGIFSADYGTVAATGTYRRGVTDRLTVETSAETAGGSALAGAGIVLNVGNFALLNAAFAASGGRGAGGSQVSIGVQRVGTRFTAGFSATHASGGYRDVAAIGGDTIPRLQLVANVGVSLPRFGSLGVSYSQVDRDALVGPLLPVVPDPSGVAGTVLGTVYLPPAQHAKVLSASYSTTFRSVSLTATGFANFAGTGGNGIALSLSKPFGRRSSAGVGVASSSGGGRVATAQATRSAVSVGDFGYQASASVGATSQGFAEGLYKAPWALLSAGADVSGRQVTVRANARGSLAYLAGQLFAANTIDDSFAVVDAGLPNVRVRSENREMGRTDARGRLLIPELRSFDLNHISIEPTDIPQDTTLVTTTREVRPQDRSGVVVGFAVKVSHGALLHIADRGVPLAIGSTATLRATRAVAPVGYDGAVYLEDLAARNAVDIERPDGSRCVVSFDYIAVAGEIPTIGPLPCHA